LDSGLEDPDANVAGGRRAAAIQIYVVVNRGIRSNHQLVSTTGLAPVNRATGHMRAAFNNAGQRCILSTSDELSTANDGREVDCDRADCAARARRRIRVGAVVSALRDVTMMPVWFDKAPWTVTAPMLPPAAEVPNVMSVKPARNWPLSKPPVDVMLVIPPTARKLLFLTAVSAA